MTRLIPEQTIRDAYAYYRAEPCRTLEQAAAEWGIHRRTLARKVAQMGLASKSQQERKPAETEEERQAREETAARVVESYRAGKSVGEIAHDHHLSLPAILKLLRAAGEVCPRCEVLLRETEPYGVAVLASGERVCQECGEVEPGGVARWEREPVEVVRDYYEISDVYAWEGER